MGFDTSLLIRFARCKDSLEVGCRNFYQSSVTTHWMTGTWFPLRFGNITMSFISNWSYTVASSGIWSQCRRCGKAHCCGAIPEVKILCGLNHSCQKRQWKHLDRFTPWTISHLFLHSLPNRKTVHFTGRCIGSSL